MAWYNESGVSIPPFWALCDGSRGTPNLRDTYLVAAGANFVAGTTENRPAAAQTAWAFDRQQTSCCRPPQDTNVQINSTLPPYHAVQYIMFIGENICCSCACKINGGGITNKTIHDVDVNPNNDLNATCTAMCKEGGVCPDLGIGSFIRFCFADNNHPPRV